MFITECLQKVYYCEVLPQHVLGQLDFLLKTTSL